MKQKRKKKKKNFTKADELIYEREHVNLLLGLAVIGNESQTLELAIQKTLQQICLYTSWPVGHGYFVDREHPEFLLSTKLWYLQSKTIFRSFKEVTEKTHFQKGLGLPGRVLDCGQALWVFDVTEEADFPRRKVALDVGVRSAFAFPILAQGQVVAVLEFFSGQRIKKNESLFDIVAHVGRQLGQVYDRERSSIQIRQLNQDLERRVQIKTDELAIQQQIIFETRKMSALGEMAAGIAHEINNPLAIIKTISQQMQDLLEEDSLDRFQVIEMAKKVEKTSDRIAKIILGLKYFSRNDSKDHCRKVSIHQLIEETLSFCRQRFISHGMSLIVEKFNPKLIFNGRCTEISQVLLNLLNNAHDALLCAKEKWVKVSVLELPNWIEIRVKDSGHGISPEIEKKIFQPFFTTKKIGKGTGLGLSLSLGMIQSHNGTLTLDEKCANTCFVIRLPKRQPLAMTESVLQREGD